MDLTYEKYVELGKKLVEETNDKQMKICSYAMKVCTIRHGGRSGGFYTMTDYARDIGLKRKTLSEWMLIYRNVILKLTDKQRETMTWKQASKTHEAMAAQNSIDNVIKGKPRHKTGVKKSFTPTRVQKIHEELMNEKPFVGEFLGIVKQVNYAKGILSKRDLSIIQDNHLIHLMQLLDNCSDLINDYLTEKKKIQYS